MPSGTMSEDILGKENGRMKTRAGTQVPELNWSLTGPKKTGPDSAGFFCFALFLF